MSKMLQIAAQSIEEAVSCDPNNCERLLTCFKKLKFCVRKTVDKRHNFRNSSLRALIDNIHRGDDETDICGLQGSAKPFIASLLFRNAGKTILFITAFPKGGA